MIRRKRDQIEARTGPMETFTKRSSRGREIERAMHLFIRRRISVDRPSEKGSKNLQM